MTEQNGDSPKSPEDATIVGLSRLITEMHAEMRGTRDDINSLRGEVAGLREEIASLRGELRAFKRDVGQDISALNARVTANQATIDNKLNLVRQEIIDLSRESAQRANATQALTDASGARITGISLALERVKDEILAIKRSLERAEASIEA